MVDLHTSPRYRCAFAPISAALSCLPSDFLPSDIMKFLVFLGTVRDSTAPEPARLGVCVSNACLDCYLACGRLENGFLRVRFNSCSHEHLAWAAPLPSVVPTVGPQANVAASATVVVPDACWRRLRFPYLHLHQSVVAFCLIEVNASNTPHDRRQIPRVAGISVSMAISENRYTQLL